MGRVEVDELWLEWLGKWEAWDQLRSVAMKESRSFVEARPASP